MAVIGYVEENTTVFCCFLTAYGCLLWKVSRSSTFSRQGSNVSDVVRRALMVNGHWSWVNTLIR